MAGFDRSLDKNLFSETIEFENTRVIVGVFQYNEGQKKLQLSRENKNAEEEWKFAKLGRLTKAEAEKVIPVMQKAMDVME